MEPFNIKIRYGQNEVTLTILPTAHGYYKVIYFGGILGAVHQHSEGWQLVPEDELIAGDLPMYTSDLSNDHVEIILNEHTVEKIGEEINYFI